MLQPTNRVNVEARIQKTSREICKPLSNVCKEVTQNIKDQQGKKESVNKNTKKIIEIMEKTDAYFRKKIKTSGSNKSKVKFLLEGKQKDGKLGQRPEYMIKLSRNQPSITFKARTL